MTSFPPAYGADSPGDPVRYGESQPPTDPTAVMGRRIIAWILDLALWFLVLTASVAALGETVEVDEAADPCTRLEEQYGTDRVGSCIDLRDLFDGEVYVLTAADTAVQSLVSLGYLALFIVVQGGVGGSPGKLLVGLRVVTPEGRRAGVGRSFVRTLLWVVDGAPWFVPLVGAITGLTTSGHRRVGDMAAGTYVVAAASVGAPVVAPSYAPQPGAGWAAPQPGPPPSTWEPRPHPPPEASSPPVSSETAPQPGVAAWDEGFVAPDATPEPASSIEATAQPEFPPPQWDAARNTYIQWDPGAGVWLQWDASASRWKPIDT